MIPIRFPQANIRFGPPPDLDESQCMTVWAFMGTVTGGPIDGAETVIVAWQPDEADRARIAAGGVVYLSVVGGLPPHYLTTETPNMVPRERKP